MIGWITEVIHDLGEWPLRLSLKLLLLQSVTCHGEMNNRRFMGIEKYKSGRGGGGGGGGCICVDRWKRSHVGIAVDIEYESVMHRRVNNVCGHVEI